MKVDTIAMLYEWGDTGHITQEVYDKISYKKAGNFLGVKSGGK